MFETVGVMAVSACILQMVYEKIEKQRPVVDYTEENKKFREQKEQEAKEWSVQILPYLEKEKEQRSEPPVICVEDLTMRFRIATNNVSGIKEYLIQARRRVAEYAAVASTIWTSTYLQPPPTVGTTIYLEKWTAAGKRCRQKLQSWAVPEPTVKPPFPTELKGIPNLKLYCVANSTTLYKRSETLAVQTNTGAIKLKERKPRTSRSTSPPNWKPQEPHWQPRS